MTVNEPLLREAMTYIKLHPEEWNQNDWACGTTACLAGTAVMLHHGMNQSDLLDYFRKWPIAEEAAELLGLSDGQTTIFGASWCVNHDQTLRECSRTISWEERHASCSEEALHPTYAAFEAFVSKKTGVKFKDGVEIQ